MSTLHQALDRALGLQEERSLVLYKQVPPVPEETHSVLQYEAETNTKWKAQAEYYGHPAEMRLLLKVMIKY